MSDTPVNNVTLGTVTAIGADYKIIHVQKRQDLEKAVGVLVKAWPKWKEEILKNHGLKGKDDSAEPAMRVVVAAQNAKGEDVSVCTLAINPSGTIFFQYITTDKGFLGQDIDTQLAELALQRAVEVAKEIGILVKAAWAEITPGKPEQAIQNLLYTSAGQIFYPGDNPAEENLPRANRDAWQKVVKAGIESNTVWYTPINNASEAEAATAVAVALENISWTNWYEALDFAGRLKYAATQADGKPEGPIRAEVNQFIKTHEVGEGNDPFSAQLDGWRAAAASSPVVLAVIETALELPPSPIVAFLVAHRERNQLILTNIAKGNAVINDSLPPIPSIQVGDKIWPAPAGTDGKPNTSKPGKGGGTPPTPPGN